MTLNEHPLPGPSGRPDFSGPDAVAEHLLSWFASAARDLPWRRRRDPYAVWISEVMLQQTQVATVIPYFERWMAQFPDVHALATAPLTRVLKAWEGLGYYARARHLHRAAQELVRQHGGQLPADRERLLQIPGIGPYTAGAILSLAFGQREPVLDGNVRRVLCRLYDISEDPRAPEVERHLWELADRLVQAAPAGRAGELNEALMELGALVCVPGQPRCGECPLAGTNPLSRGSSAPLPADSDSDDATGSPAPGDASCRAALCLSYCRGVQAQRPVRVPKRPSPHYDLAAAIIHEQGRYLIVERRPGGLLGGLWGFPATVAGECDIGQPTEPALARYLTEALRTQLGLRVTVGQALPPIGHAYTHFRITLHAFHCQIQADEKQTLRPSGAPAGNPAAQSQPDNPLSSPGPYTQVRWVPPGELASYPLAGIDRKVVQSLGIG